MVLKIDDLSAYLMIYVVTCIANSMCLQLFLHIDLRSRVCVLLLPICMLFSHSCRLFSVVVIR